MNTLLAATALLWAAQAEPKAPSGLEQMRSLEGTWESRDTDHPAKISYKASSGGSVVVESTSMPGHGEMITVYHADGKDLVLTHYCTLGNQPRMRAERAQNPGELRFRFDGGTNVNPSDKHMHSLTIAFIDADHIREEWSLYDGGKEVHVVKIPLTRKKE